MPKKIFLLLYFCYPFLINGQYKAPYIKIYAYQQEVYAGIDQPIAKVDDSVVINTSSPVVHYLIYVEKINAGNFRPNKIWIRNKCYSLVSEKVITPVIQQKNVAIVNQAFIDTLVKATTSSVYQLRIGKEKKENPSQKLRTLIQQNELVLMYTAKRKIYYKSLREIKVIAPLISQ